MLKDESRLSPSWKRQQLLATVPGAKAWKKMLIGVCSALSESFFRVSSKVSSFSADVLVVARQSMVRSIYVIASKSSSQLGKCRGAGIG